MILVTGASGLIGSHLCKKLLSEGYQVVGLVHKRANPVLDSLLDHNNLNISQGDIREECFIQNLFEMYQINTVFHTAAHLPYTFDNDLVGVNIMGTLALLYSAYRYRVEKFIYASSMAVYSDPPCYLPINEGHPKQPSTIYGMTKRAGELSCLDFADSMAVLILRYAGIYGLGSEENRAVNKFIRATLNEEPLIVNGDGSQSSDFVYVDDVVEGTYRAWVQNVSGIYNLGSGQDATILDLAEMIKEIVGSKSEIVCNGDEIDRPFRFFLDISKAEMDFGYSPRLLKEGLMAYVAEYNRIS